MACARRRCSPVSGYSGQLTRPLPEKPPISSPGADFNLPFLPAWRSFRFLPSTTTPTCTHWRRPTVCWASWRLTWRERCVTTKSPAFRTRSSLSQSCPTCCSPCRTVPPRGPPSLATCRPWHRFVIDTFYVSCAYQPGVDPASKVRRWGSVISASVSLITGSLLQDR